MIWPWLIGTRYMFGNWISRQGKAGDECNVFL